MSLPPGAWSGRGAALARGLLDVRLTATTASDALLSLVPDTGDHATGRSVDDFVEQASDALRALVESIGETVAALGPAAAPSAGEPAPEPHAQQAPPRWWVS